MPKNRIIPFYTLEVDNTVEGMDFMGLVDLPAHMKSFIKFGKDDKKAPVKTHFNDEQRIVTGVAIAVDLPIYRNDEEYGEHYVVFKAAEAKKIAIKMMENNYLHNVNEMHDSNKALKGLTLFESYFIDEDKGLYPEMFKDQNLKKGSWIVSYKVNNDDAWDKIKSGEFAGFSIEGWFKKVPLRLKGQFNAKRIKLAKIQQMSTWDLEVMEETMDFGTVLHYAYRDAEGTLYDGGHLQSGEYVAPDGKKIMVDSRGAVVMIDGKAKEAQRSTKTKTSMKKKGFFAKLMAGLATFASAMTTDGIEIFWDGDLKKGTECYYMDENGEKVLVKEGTHSWKNEDGTSTVITVDGKGLLTADPETVTEDMGAGGAGGDGGEDMSETEQAIEELHKVYEARFKKLEGEKTALSGQLADLTKKFGAAMAQLDKLTGDGDGGGGEFKGGKTRKTWKDKSK